MKLRKYNTDKIAELKKAIQSGSIRDAARACSVSYYMAWCVASGRYDNGRLQYYQSEICPITGFKLCRGL